MNKVFVRALAVLFVLCLVGSATTTWSAASQAPAASPKASGPVLLTSCGQSPGPARLAAFLKRSTVEFDYVALATTADLAKKPYKTVVIVTGASLKGMGGAGVEIDDEISRIGALIAEAKKRNITVIGSHIEGMARRSQGASAGDTSDEQSIDAVCPKSNILLVMREGDSDKRFTTIATKGKIPMIAFDKYAELEGVLKGLFAK